MRSFEHFPETSQCKICGTSRDSPCVLIGVDGTESDGNEEAIPVHVDCINSGGWRYNREVGVIYRVVG